MATRIKRLLLILPVALFLVQLCSGQDIDLGKLKTKADVQRFLAANVDTNYKTEKVFGRYTNDTSAYGRNKFFKLPLSNTGLTALIVNGTELFAVTHDGEEMYTKHLISLVPESYPYDRCNLRNIIHTDKGPLLVVSRYDEDSASWQDRSGTDTLWYTPVKFKKNDTLAYRFGGFIEYNPKPDSFKIESITLNVNFCLWRCQVFRITVSADSTILYNAIKNNPKDGIFKGRVSDYAYGQLAATLNYMQLNSMKPRYEWNGGFDNLGYILEIKYNGGRVKKITCNGTYGTYGFENLVNQLSDIVRVNQWL